jgi:hypothetical protein
LAGTYAKGEKTMLKPFTRALRLATQATLGIVMLGFSHGCSGPGDAASTPMGSQATAKGETVQFTSLEGPRDLPEGVSLFLQCTEQPSDRVMLGIASAGRALCNLRLELHAGDDVVYTYRRIDVDVHAGGLAITPITLTKPVMADTIAWQKYWLNRGGEAALTAAGDYPRVRVSRFSAILK